MKKSGNKRKQTCTCHEMKDNVKIETGMRESGTGRVKSEAYKGWIIDNLQHYGNSVVPDSVVQGCIEVMIKKAGIEAEVHKGISGDWIAEKC